MRPSPFPTVALALAALAGLSPCQAQIFKCPVGESVSFQQGPCNGLSASGGRLVRTADGSIVRVADVIALAPTSPAASDPAVSPQAGRVYGRTPLPSSKEPRSAKSP